MFSVNSNSILSDRLNISVKATLAVGFEVGVSIENTSNSIPGMSINEMIKKHLHVPAAAIRYQTELDNSLKKLGELQKNKKN